MRLSQQSEVCVCVCDGHWPLCWPAPLVCTVCVCVCTCVHLCVYYRAVWLFWQSVSLWIIFCLDLLGCFFFRKTGLKFSRTHSHSCSFEASQTHAVVFQLINQQQSFQFFILPNNWFKKNNFFPHAWARHASPTHTAAVSVFAPTQTLSERQIRTPYISHSSVQLAALRRWERERKNKKNKNEFSARLQRVASCRSRLETLTVWGVRVELHVLLFSSCS